MKHQAFEITFANTPSSKAVKISRDSPLTGIPEALKISSPDGVIVIIGGAGVFDTPDYDSIRAETRLLMDTVAQLAQEKNLAVISGGTSSGVMQQIGESWASVDGGFPLIGVSPLGNIHYPGHRPDGESYPLDPNHSAFILIESSTWGDETTVIAEFTHLLAQGKPTLEIIINGGAIAREDAAAYLERGGELITVQGSGRFADDLATAAIQKKSDDPELQSLLDSGQVHVFSLDDGPAAFRAMLLKISGW